jgi:hypothetical protein
VPEKLSRASSLASLTPEQQAVVIAQMTDLQLEFLQYDCRGGARARRSRQPRHGRRCGGLGDNRAACRGPEQDHYVADPSTAKIATAIAATVKQFCNTGISY